MLDRKDVAEDFLLRGYNCCQSVLVALAEDVGIDKEVALKIGSGFGMGLCKGEVCGAVIGATTIIGMKYSNVDIKGLNKESKVEEVVQKFIEEFEKKNSSIICRELLGYDVTKPTELEKVINKRLFENLCPSLVKNSIELIEKIES